MMVEAFEALATPALRATTSTPRGGVFFDEARQSRCAVHGAATAQCTTTRVGGRCAPRAPRLRERCTRGRRRLRYHSRWSKLKDTGFSGLPRRTKGTFEDLYLPTSTAPGAFAQLASAYAERHGYSMAELKRAMAHISCKSHENATRITKAHLRNRRTAQQVLDAPIISC
jgi:acetyl-CoA C-acetyltransferase